MRRLEHSPLPWTVLTDGTHIVDPNAWTVADCRFGDSCKANANLIVAAVNSHAALLAAAKELLQVRGEWGHPAWAHLHEAIAKAEEPAP